MNAHDVIRDSINGATMISQGYLADLSDADLLVRPVPNANHTAWQLGHLIHGENEMINACCPGSMPALPAGFAEKHTKETAKLDSASSFLTKEKYLSLMAEQRAATLKALEKLSAADLDKPAPEQYQNFVKTVGAVFNMQGVHWLMHVGQWAVVRRKLNRPVLF